MDSLIVPSNDPQSRADRAILIQILRRMTPEERIRQAFKLTERTRRLRKPGIRNRHSELTEDEVHEL